MFGIGTSELFLIFLIVFLLFGAKSLPEIAKSIGKAVHLFKKGINEVEDEVTLSSDNQKTPAKKDS